MTSIYILQPTFRTQLTIFAMKPKSLLHVTRTAKETASQWKVHSSFQKRHYLIQVYHRSGVRHVLSINNIAKLKTLSEQNLFSALIIA